jgi:hypothetical protein
MVIWHVLRGSGWLGFGGDARSAKRLACAPADRGGSGGFRLAAKRIKR